MTRTLAPPPARCWHVWLTRLPEESESFYAEAKRHCAREEWQRAHSMALPRVRRERLASRVALRKILARYLDLPAAEVELGESELGKPFLRPSSLFFNVSHSGPWIGIAIGTDGEVGIDLEVPMQHPSFRAANARVRMLRLAARVLSPREAQGLSELDDEELALRLFSCWVRKEALLKACGLGIRMELTNLGLEQGSDGFWHSDLPEMGRFQVTMLSPPRLLGHEPDELTFAALAVPTSGTPGHEIRYARFDCLQPLPEEPFP